jgi:putative hemolysin
MHPMESIATDLFILFVLIIFNGLLALSELAVVSARRPRLQQMAVNGQRGAQIALELAASPGQFLSTVQVGITLVGILAGAYSGATVADNVAIWLARVPGLAAYANAIAVGVVVVVITYLSLVIGELVPKRLALRNAEAMAVRVAPGLQLLARITGPVVNVLNASTEWVLRVLGAGSPIPPRVTEDEVRLLLAEATQQGVFEPREEEIVDQVFRLADRRVGALITPRTEMVWLDVNSPTELLRAQIIESGRSRLPVANGQLDHVLGVVLAKDLLAQALEGRPLDLRAIVRPALFVPESMPALTLVERFKQTHHKLAVVIDEYGGVEGIVTVDDVLAAIVGDIPEPDEQLGAGAVQRDDGSWLIDGLFSVDDFLELFDIAALPTDMDGYYQTVGGFVMARLGQVPVPGDHFDWQSLRFEVVDMDDRRVDKVLVTRIDDLPPTAD